MRKVEYKDTEIAVKKKLGQNFLTDRNITRKIVTASGAGSEENILEIGPGFGALTREIIDVCPAFTVMKKIGDWRNSSEPNTLSLPLLRAISLKLT